MKWLIVGLGSIGKRHLRNLLTLGEKDILLYRTHLGTHSDDAFSAIPVETDLEAALAHQPDAVIIANPTAQHLKVAIPAAKAGCHLLLEKPLAEKFNEDVEQLEQVVSAAGVKTLVGFQFRFHPVLRQIKTLLSAGVLGRVYSFRVHWGEYLPDWHPWEDYRDSYAARKELGGGVVNTLSHPLDYVRWLFGEVESLSAVTGHVSTLEMDVEDLAEITLQFRNGSVGSIHLDYYQRPPAHWIEINAEKGFVRWEYETGNARIYTTEDQQWKWIKPEEDFERNTLYLEELQHFIELITLGGESNCSLSDGIRALELTDAVHASAKLRQQILCHQHR
jgi:predicted dehydrogenase